MTNPSEPCGKTVLVIDDDEDFCASMRELLAGRGYIVETCASAGSALSWLSTHDAAKSPCAIVVDLRMPDMDGYSFLATCEVEPRLREIPVIVVSAYGDPTGIEADFISKPVNVSRLLRSLESAC
ncbi:MAG: response regulator [Myxococcota bacterium]|nr:response regulator [Myxococcota bacterium]